MLARFVAFMMSFVSQNSFCILDIANSKFIPGNILVHV